MSFYGFRCEYCEGTVREQVLAREAITHHRGIVILENVPVGVCDHCGAHYHAAQVLHRVESILKSSSSPKRTLQVPIEAF